MNTKLIQLATELSGVLIARQKRITTAESCTGGLIAATLTEIAGSSAWFERGFVTYSNEAKMELLAVKPTTLANYGAVSAETAGEMAIGALNNSHADYSIAVTGIAGPSGGTLLKPVGTVFIAWAIKNQPAIIKQYLFIGDRADIRKQTLIAALSCERFEQLLAI
jgi:nicotinamide-nucleotide amidase